MRAFIDSVREEHVLEKRGKKARAFGCAVLICSMQFLAAQAPAPSHSAALEPLSTAASVSTGKPTGLAATLANAPHESDGSISEEQFRELLVGKSLYLRGDFLDNSLDFDEHGNLAGHSSRGSYTLCLIKITKEKFSKHKVELEGDRYALHFLGQLPHEDPLKDVDRVKITPKKKVVKIAIDREQVEKPKKEKHKGTEIQNAQAGSQQAQTAFPSSPFSGSAPRDSATTDTAAEALPEGKHFSATATPAHASQMLVDALDRVFAPDIDDRMIEQMPAFWKLYYKAAASNKDYSSTDPGVYRQNSVDQKAKLLSTVEPPSNEFAQSNGVAGMALYHVVIGVDGKATEVVAGRPIGFGLDENAVDTISKATFQSAMKNGKPVPVALELVVSFRIYSKRTSQPAIQQATDEPVLPGPYSVQHE